MEQQTQTQTYNPSIITEKNYPQALTHMQTLFPEFSWNALFITEKQSSQTGDHGWRLVAEAFKSQQNILYQNHVFAQVKHLCNAKYLSMGEISDTDTKFYNGKIKINSRNENEAFSFDNTNRYQLKCNKVDFNYIQKAAEQKQKLQPETDYGALPSFNDRYTSPTSTKKEEKKIRIGSNRVSIIENLGEKKISFPTNQISTVSVTSQPIIKTQHITQAQAHLSYILQKDIHLNTIRDTPSQNSSGTTSAPIKQITFICDSIINPDFLTEFSIYRLSASLGVNTPSYAILPSFAIALSQLTSETLNEWKARQKDNLSKSTPIKLSFDRSSQ